MLTVGAGLPGVAVAVTAEAHRLAIRGVPGAGVIAVADAVCVPTACVSGGAAAGGTGVARTEVISATAAGAAAEVFDLVNADAVPLCRTAVRVLGADTCLDPWVTTTRPVLHLAAVTAPTARTAVGLTALAVFAWVAVAITTARTASTTIVSVPCTGALAIADAVSIPSAAVPGCAAARAAGVARTELISTAAAAAAAEVLDLAYAEAVPGVVAAEVVLGTDAGLYAGIPTPRSGLWLAAISTTPTRTAVLLTAGAGLVGVAIPVTTEARGLAVGAIPGAGVLTITDSVVAPPAWVTGGTTAGRA